MRDNTASVLDRYFTSDNTPEGAKAQIDDIQAKTRGDSHTVRVGMNAFIIACGVEEEVRVVLDDIVKYAYTKAVYAFGDAVRRTGETSPENEGSWAKSTLEDLAQYNDDFRTNLINAP